MTFSGLAYVTFGLSGGGGGGGTPPTAPSLTVSDNEDATVTFTVAGADLGTTNRIFVRTLGGDWREDEEASVAGPGGSVVVALDPGRYVARVLSVSVGGQAFGATDPVPFRVRDAAAPVGQYRVIRILRAPGAQVMELMLERVEKPLEPLA